MHRARRLGRLLGLVGAGAATTLALAGCGVVDDLRYPYAGEDAETILVDAMSATSELETVRLSGSLDRKGDPPTSFNLVTTAEGRHCGGELVFSTAKFDFLVTAKGDYLRGSTASWVNFPYLEAGTGQAAADALDDRWVKAPRAGDGDLRPMCKMLRELFTSEEQAALADGKAPETFEVTNKGLSEAAGQKTVELQIVDDKGETSAWVSLDEPHYFVKVAGKDKKGELELVFSDYDLPAEFDPPQDRHVVELSR